VGGYQLGDRIGAGRISRVYRASGASGELAVKLLSPDAELDDPAAAARFRHEVDALDAVCHPNVVALVDHGVDHELGPYLVMPLLEGRTLRELITAGPIEPAICALAMRELASGLAALHSAGLVHRDLKPENVIVGQDGQPVILDLGLAWATTQTRYTEEGSIAGSVPYMAPEQIEGNDPTPATDLWALAVIAHEWITGQRPFARSRQSEEVAAILAGTFEPLATRDRRVTPELGAVIDRCLTRGQRPADGGELRDELTRLAPGDARPALRDPHAASAGQAERAARELLAEARGLLARGKAFAAADRVERAAAHRPDDPGVLALAEEVGRMPTRPRRSPLLWIGGGAVAIAIAGVGLALLLDRGDGAREPAPAPPAAPALTAAEVPEQVDPDRAGLALLEVPRHESLFATDDLEGGAIAYTMRHRPEDVAAASDPNAHAAYARALMATTRRSEGLAFLDRSLERFPDAAGLWLLQGQAALRTGDPDGADAALSRAIALDPNVAAAYRDRGELRRLRGQLRAAFRDLSRARALAPDDPKVLGGLVRIYAAIDRDQEARPLAMRATELAPRTAAPWIDLAAISRDDEALAYLEVALRNDPMSGPAWRAICLVAARLDDARAHSDCLQASIRYRSDPAIVLARASIWKRRGNLMRARSEVFAGTVSIEDDLGLWLELIELDQALDNDYALAKSRARACELGHQPSCAAASADKAVVP